MKNVLWMLSALPLLLGVPAPAAMAESLVTFNGGIGVNPVSNVANNQTVGDATRNDVRGVPPGGQPWVISKLKARVKEDGAIKVQGEGLLLAGGNGIGTNGGASVFASLFCGPAASATEHSSDREIGVPLEANGDFRIQDVLSPTPPVPCESPVLLIRNLAGRWFAAGIPGQD